MSYHEKQWFQDFNVISGSNVDTVVFSLRFPGISFASLTSLYHSGTALAVSRDTASPFADWCSEVSHSQGIVNWLAAAGNKLTNYR